jgi:hypothetical protein
VRELKCSLCKETKDSSLFPKANNKKRGFAWECTMCKKEARDNKKKSMSSEDWSLLHRSYYLKSAYGITLEEYNNKLKQQNHKCAICKTDEVDVMKQTLYVDHCHKTNKVRGLLCHPCNVSLGLLKENIEVLDNAKTYLLEHL